MPTGNNIRLSKEDLNIELTTMAIRERLMEYYKGTCIERFIRNSNVKLRDVNRSHLQYQYQRRDAEAEKLKLLVIGNTPVATLCSYPFKITFHMAALDRSPQLRKIHSNMEDFMREYLDGVVKEYNNADIPA